MMRRMKYLATSLAIAGTMVFTDGATKSALAHQCFYNTVGTGIVATVKWYEPGSLIYKINEDGERTGYKAAKEPVAEENIAVGQTSCAPSAYNTYEAMIYVSGGEHAKNAAVAALIIGGLAAGAAVGVAGGAAVGAAIGGGGTTVAGISAMATTAGAGAGFGMFFGEIGAIVGIANLPDVEEGYFSAGVPSHYRYTNIGGTVFDPWVEKGSAKPILLGNAANELMLRNYFTPNPGRLQKGRVLVLLQNIPAENCAFWCILTVGCKGFNFFPNAGIVFEERDGVPFPLRPALQNSCELYGSSRGITPRKDMDPPSTIFYSR